VAIGDQLRVVVRLQAADREPAGHPFVSSAPLERT